MVCISKNKKTQNGDGIIDIIKSAFVESKFPGEMHMAGTSYTGPGTRLDIRTSGYPDYIPNGDIGQSVSKLDNISREHDIAYDKIKHDYLEHGDKQTHLKQIHEADDKFINDAKKEGIKGKIASNLIKLKKYGEENNYIDSKRFSGFGMKDPTLRLKLLAKQQKKHDDKQYGGFLPLVPIGATILSALGGKLVGELYDLVKRKIKGTGYEHKMKHNTLYEKRKFLNHVLNKY